MSALRHARTDVVVVGSGWAGSIIALELARAGYGVVMLERGPERTGTEYEKKMDELRFSVDLELMQDTANDTVTLRHDEREPALPLRRWGSFLVGTGKGGGGTHWSGVTYRYPARDFVIRSSTLQRYGAKAIPADSRLEDWGVTYADLEPYYDRFEYMAGIAGKAGNLGGKIVAGGNPFESPRRREYPLPPMKTAASPYLFRTAAREAGLHPAPEPSGNASAAYTNPDRISRGACNYCGFCSRYACEVSAKADPTVTTLAAAAKSERFELRTEATVNRILHDGTSASGVTYFDKTGALHEQPANVVVIAAYTFASTRLLLLSKLGTPYDPQTERGVVGRNFALQPMGYHTAFFEDRQFKRFMGSGANGWFVDDFGSDNFDHAGLGFIGGGIINCEQVGAAPIGGAPVPPGTPAWGPHFKAALKHYYDRAMAVTFQGENLPHRFNFLDLDPTYRDIYGDPLTRITFNWTENERKMVAYTSLHGAQAIMRAAGAHRTALGDTLPDYYDTARYQTSHITGGTPMGTDPATSVTNTYGQMWDAHNVFVAGGSLFRQNGGRNPTGTIGALAYRTADALVHRYMRAPGALA